MCASLSVDNTRQTVIAGASRLSAAAGSIVRSRFVWIAIVIATVAFGVRTLHLQTRGGGSESTEAKHELDCKEHLLRIYQAVLRYQSLRGALPNAHGLGFARDLIVGGAFENTEDATCLTCPAASVLALSQGTDYWFHLWVTSECDPDDITSYAFRDTERWPLSGLGSHEPLVADANRFGCNHPHRTFVLYADGLVGEFVSEQSPVRANDDRPFCSTTTGLGSSIAELRKLDTSW